MQMPRVGLCSRAGLAGPALLLLMILSCSNGFAQEDYYQKLEQECLDMANRGEYAASLEKARELYAAYPENLTAHLVVAFDLINLGRHKDANGYINAAFAIDPTNFYSYFNAAYYYVLEGDVAKAKEYLVESMKLYPEGYPMKDVIDDLHKVGNNTNKAAVFNQLADWYPQHLSTVKERYPSILEVTAAFNKTPEKTRQIADEYAEKFMKLKWPEMAIGVYAYACIWLRSYGQPSESLAAAQAGYNYYRKNGYGANPFQATKLVSEMLDTYATLGNDEKIIDFAEEIFDLSDQLPLHVHDVNALILTAGAYERLNKHEEARKIATAAYQLAEKAGNRHGATAAANMLCIVYNYVIYNTDVNNAVYFGETALQIALKYKFEVLIGSITGNLAVAYGKVNTYEAQAKGAQLYGSLLKIYKDKQMWGEASLTLNNMGAGMYASKGYQYAAEYFEESIELAKRVQGEMSAADKLTYYQSQMSAYEFLAACYAQLGNAEKAYEAIEASRSRVLTERLAKGREVRPGTIADVQNMLAPDEAAIFYDLFTAHEVIILVITKKYSRVLFHTDDSFIGGIKEKYLDRINKEHGERRGQDQTVPASRDTRVIMADFQKVTQLTRKFFERPGMADELLKEYLQGYYKFLILPVLNRLNGIKSLLISPDGVLNYIPFEALQMFNGKYLVENYSLRYLNSAGALRFINERQYAAGRKPLMAMGGAIYEPNTTPAMAINKQHDMNSLVAEVEENKLAGRSQRKAYATLFGNNAMNPLPGTLAEVNSLSQNVPGAQVFTGRDFTENRLKAMSKDGSLKQFKVLHLATHGFVVEEIPDLSGVAMSVFTNEQEGEDGFLNVEEFASLNINADLTVLSACQTALGKIYSGEGVTGLTQSLLIAGSNAALVSLWPVNDTSTSLFMSDLYKESQKGKSYAQVVTELKRKFIKGDYGAEFKHPNFWAPFVYFGR